MIIQVDIDYYYSNFFKENLSLDFVNGCFACCMIAPCVLMTKKCSSLLFILKCAYSGCAYPVRLTTNSFPDDNFCWE